jgi:hypothetical protein
MAAKRAADQKKELEDGKMAICDNFLKLVEQA